MDEFDRVLREHGYVPFQRVPWVNPETGRVEPRVLGERLPLRWRVARDFWDRYCAPLVPDGMLLEYGGWPVERDDAAPPGTLVLEPVGVLDETVKR